jgi:hypothetical protein
MRTRDRIVRLAALGLLALGLQVLGLQVLGPGLGLTPAFAFEGTTRQPAEVAPAAPSMSRAVQSDVPRPPGMIPRTGSAPSGAAAAGAVAPAAAMPNAALPRPRAPVPVLSAPDTTLGGRPLPPPTAFAAPAAPIAPFEALRSGTRALKDGQKQKALVSLEYAAEQGVVAAQWKLGRMYAEGDGVEQSDVRAFEYFSRIADGHADDNPVGPEARYVANAFVSLGHYYREGIADTDVRADLPRARHMYAYAASYFGDADAQYHLARLMLENGPYRDPRQAARWLHAAANKGQYQAQAVLGRMLFRGETGARQPARGLMWLALANSNAGPGDTWIGELYESAFKQATSDDRAIAGDMLVRWVNGKRD